MAKPRIGVFALGGTIAMVKGDAGGVKPGLGADDLVAAVPELPTLAEISAETVARLPSPCLTADHVHGLAQRIEALAAAAALDGAIVTQGTDTIEETAFLLDCLLDLAIPVIVVGAMRNPLATSPDGPGNLLAAVRVAVDPEVRRQARALGVLVVMLDSIHAAQEVVKADSHRVDAFASPQAGPLGTIVEDRVRLSAMPRRPHLAALRAALGPAPAGRLAGRPASVACLPLALGDDGALVKAILASPQHLGLDGVVLGLMGGGHAPDWLADEIGLLAAALPVVGCGRMGSGALLRATYEFPGGEIDLRRRGVIAAGRLHPFKARVLLGLLLRAAPREAIAEVFAAFD